MTSYCITLLYHAIFLSPLFLICHPEAKPKGLRDSSPSAQNDRKRRLRKEGILRSLALGSIIKIVSIISGSFLQHIFGLSCLKGHIIIYMPFTIQQVLFHRLLGGDVTFELFPLMRVIPLQTWTTKNFFVLYTTICKMTPYYFPMYKILYNPLKIAIVGFHFTMLYKKWRSHFIM